MGSIAETSTTPGLDVLIIGAGISGLYLLHLVRRLGLRVKILEAGKGVGGTWYWNRYPGARFDSETYTYCYSFSKEILQEWDWTEHFAAQPETERYLNFVADKLALRDDIQFDSRVDAAQYIQREGIWNVGVESGVKYTARFLVTAVGPLSMPTLPQVPGIADFNGISTHTARWPQGGIDFAGKRVAVVGTGATGIQTIQEVAKTAGTLTVFQRRPNWCAPLGNRKIDAEEMAHIKTRYDDIFAKCRDTYSCFLHAADSRSTLEVTPEEREALYERLYSQPGFGLWLGNFRDSVTDPRANTLLSDFVARKIRQRVKNPETAEKLIPKCHGFGTRRVPLETRYYEVYNQPNVTLVDLASTPLERVTEKGLRTTETEYEFDIIIYATGFDPVTGGFDAINITGLDGASLREKWATGPITHLGVAVPGFPNMLMCLGPHAALGNIPRAIEYNVEWIAGLLAHARDLGLTYLEPTEEAAIAWTEHVKNLTEGLLGNDVDSWMTGVNSNVHGKQNRIVATYSGSVPDYRARCDEVAKHNYVGWTLR